LQHLCDTEGEINFNPNATFNDLTLPELTGDAVHKRRLAGENPELSFNAFLADPALRAIISPTGEASGGYVRQRPVKRYTLVVFPEALFGEYDDISYDGTKWTVGGSALTPDQERYLGLSFWCWSGSFERAGMTYISDNGGKLVIPVVFRVMPTTLPLSVIPDGHRLYTVGDPADAGIDIHPQA